MWKHLTKKGSIARGPSVRLPPVKRPKVVDERIANFLKERSPELSEAIDELVEGWTKSVSDQDLVYARISKYDRVYPEYKDLPHWVQRRLEKAIKKAHKLFVIRKKLNPLHLSEVEITKGTSPGASWRLYGKSGLKGDPWVDGEALTKAQTMLSMLLRGRKVKFEPCLTAIRTQLGPSSSPKVRVVWVAPYEVVLLESAFAQPYQKALMDGNAPILGRDQLSIALGVDRIRWRHQYVIGTDYSGFDATVPPFLIKAVFAMIKRSFEPKWLPVLNALEGYFIHTTIVLPNGDIVQKHGGIPSGSAFTQLVGSIVNWIISKACAPEADVWCVGDDSFIGSESMDIDRFARFAAYLGMMINPDKSERAPSTSSVTFLGRKFVNGVAYWDDSKILLHLLHPERPGIKLKDRLLGYFVTYGMYSWLAKGVAESFRVSKSDSVETYRLGRKLVVVPMRRYYLAAMS